MGILTVYLDPDHITKNAEMMITTIVGCKPVERKQAHGQLTLKFEIADQAKGVSLGTDLRSRRFKGYVGALFKG